MKKAKTSKGCCDINETQLSEDDLKLIDKNENSKNKSLKNEGKIRIYFYRENPLEKFIKQTSKKEEKIKEADSEYIKGYNNALNWEYFFFEEITEGNNKVISKYMTYNFEMKDFYDIIIVTTGKISDNESKLFFKYFQNYSDQISKQPFILYLTKEEENPDVTKLYDLITNEYFDKRALYALKYPNLNNEFELKSVLEQICKFRNYYHEQGDSFVSFNDELSTEYKFNILICGKAGTGKSSFINKFLEERKAKEGEGLSVTHKIVSYCNCKYPINIADTPGFENENTVEEVIHLLDKYNKKLLDARKKINLIIYFFRYSDNRPIYVFEYRLLQKLFEYNTEIVFVMNFVTDKITSRHYLTKQQILINSLKQLFPKKFPIKIFPLNLYSNINDDDPDNIIIIKEIGLDILYRGIYDIFKNNLIEIKDIKNIHKVEDLFKLFENKQLYSHFKRINDLFISIRSEISNLILSYARLNLISFNKIKNMIKLANLIYQRCIGKDCEKIDEYLSKLTSDEKVKEYYEDFTNSLEILKSYNKEIHSMYFYNLIHDHKTLALGFLCLQDLEKQFESNPNIFLENDKINFDLVINLCRSINEAINGFNELSNKYENIYKSQYEYKNKKNIIESEEYNKIDEEKIDSIEKKDLNENIIDVKGEFGGC